MDTKIKAAEVYSQSRSIDAVASELQVSRTQAYRLLRKAGVDTSQGLQDWRRRAKRFTPEVEVEIAQKYAAGASLNQLVTEYGGCQYTIKRALKRNSVPTRNRGQGYKTFAGEVVQQMVDMYNSGMSQQAIATAFTTTQGLVSRVLRERGVYMRGYARGSRVHGWKGGRISTDGGYIQVLFQQPEHIPFVAMRNRTGYILEHRLVMAQHLGRALRKDETVHHVNGDRTDNRLENLQLRQGKHGKGAAYRCQACGSHDVMSVQLG